LTIEYDPNDREKTAKMNRTFQVPIFGVKGNIYPVHIPVVDLPQDIIDSMPPSEQHRAYDVHLLFSAVTLCLN
jgi:hypothetical protein